MAGTPAPPKASRGRRRLAAIRRALALAVVAAALAATAPAASARGPDDLAQTIEQNLDGIEFRIDVSPERTVRDVEEQKRRLRLLESQAPDHPQIPELRQRIEGLEARLTETLGDDPARAASEAMASPGVVGGPSEVPGDIAVRLEEVERELSEAETGLFQGAPDAAAERLARAEEALDDIERNHAGRLPAGYVPLIVARERLATLKDQISPATPPLRGGGVPLRTTRRHRIRRRRLGQRPRDCPARGRHRAVPASPILQLIFVLHSHTHSINVLSVIRFVETGTGARSFRSPSSCGASDP